MGKITIIVLRIKVVSMSTATGIGDFFMTEKKITEKTKLAALENGADMIGVLNVINLPEHI